MEFDIQQLIQSEIKKYMEKVIFPIFDDNDIDYKHLLDDFDTKNTENNSELDIIDIDMSTLINKCHQSKIIYVHLDGCNYSNYNWKDLIDSIRSDNRRNMYHYRVYTNEELLEYIKESYINCRTSYFEILIEKKCKYYRYISDTSIGPIKKIEVDSEDYINVIDIEKPNDEILEVENVETVENVIENQQDKIIVENISEQEQKKQIEIVNVDFITLLKLCVKSTIKTFENILHYENGGSLGSIRYDLDWKELKKLVSENFVEDKLEPIPKEINTNKKLLEYIKEHYKREWRIEIVKNEIHYMYEFIIKSDTPQIKLCRVEDFKHYLNDNTYDLISCYFNDINIVEKMSKKKTYSIRDIYKYIFEKATRANFVTVYEEIIKYMKKQSKKDSSYYQITIKNNKNSLLYQLNYKYEKELKVDLKSFVSNIDNDTNDNKTDNELTTQMPKYVKFGVEKDHF